MAEQKEAFETEAAEKEMKKHDKKKEKGGPAAMDEKKMNGQQNEKDLEIERLRKKLDEKNVEIDKLKEDIRVKYQSYIDNYESIGSLVYDSKVRSDQMIKDAEEKRKNILDEADAEANRRIEAVQTEIDRRIDDGEQRYKTIEEELENLLSLVNQVQKKFMESYRSIHNIVRDMPGLGVQDPEDE